MKKYLLGLTAVLLAVAFTAFTTNEVSSKKFVTKWFERGASLNPEVASSYTFVAAAPGCPGSANVCAILVDDTDGDNILDPAELTAYKTAHGITVIATTPENDAFLRKRTAN